MNKENQNDQRLENSLDSPRVPENLIKFNDTKNQKDFEILQLKADLLQKATSDKKILKGNTKELRIYKSMLPELTYFQQQAVMGLLLSDASIQASSSRQTFRIKMQQSSKHKPFIEHCASELLEAYVLSSPAEISSRNNMFEMQTLSVLAFVSIAKAFSADSLSNIKSGAVVKKVVKPNLDIGPICLAYWFCGDGGKADYTSNKGKGIQLHAQGFDDISLQEIKKLFEKQYNWDVLIKYDRLTKNKVKELYYIEIPAKYFESFIEKVGPYIHPSMLHKLPTARKKRSRWRTLTSEQNHAFLGSSFN